ncbi:MAG: tetratricopeptide repeat protein [Myxococcota bacterium]
MMRTLPIALLLVALVAPLARAAAPPEAKQRHELAKTLFRDGKYADAAREWERVYELTQKTDLLFNIGQCHRNLGDDTRALSAFRRYLEGRPDAPNRAEVEQMIREIEAASARPTGRAASARPTGRDERKEPAPAPSPNPAPSPTAVTEPPPEAIVAAPGTRSADDAGAATPVWKKPWFWGAAGGAAVLVGVLVVVLASGGGEDGAGASGTDGAEGTLGRTGAQW